MSTITPGVVFPIQPGTPFDVGKPYSGTFIPSVWSGKLLEQFFPASTFAAIANTNWEGEIKNQGDKVIIRSAPKIAIKPYAVGTPLSYEVPEMDTIELVVDQGHYYGFQVNDVLSYQSDIKMMSMFAQSASEEMKQHVDRNCWLATFNGAHAANKGAAAGVDSAAYNMGTDAAPVALTGDNILETILAMATIMDEQNVPDTDRWLVLTPRERYLLLKSDLSKVYFTGDATTPVRNGQIGVIDRFKLYLSNLLPRAAAGADWTGGVQAGTAARHAIVAGHKTAITFAAGISKNEDMRNPDDFGDIVRGLMVYGRRVVKPESMVTCLVAG